MERLLNAGGMNEKCDADRSVKDQRCTWSFLSCGHLLGLYTIQSCVLKKVNDKRAVHPSSCKYLVNFLRYFSSTW